MIKLIRIEELIPGLYVHDLNCEWIDHNFVRSRFMVKDELTALKIKELGVHELYIDTSRGIDAQHAPTQAETEHNLTRQIEAIARTAAQAETHVSVHEEMGHARHLHRDAYRIVRDMMGDIRMGKQLAVEQIEPLVERIVNSIFRQQDALLPLAKLKTHDEYTFLHSVSVCALSTSFARTLSLPRETIRELATGALLHDVGKAAITDAILNKPTKLTDAEFSKMKSHVVQSKIILQNTPGISQIVLDVASQHHERYDGTGYPNQLKGNEISLYGQIGAIADVYDALTSNRAYHRGMPPTEALRKLVTWSKFHFSPELVQAFVRSIGIYPAGSLVKLASGRLAIVQEQQAQHLLEPIVKVMYHTTQHCYLVPELVDLRHSQDHIVGYEDFNAWQIDPACWLPE